MQQTLKQYICLNKGSNEEPVLFLKQHDIFFRLVEN